MHLPRCYYLRASFQNLLARCPNVPGRTLTCWFIGGGLWGAGVKRLLAGAAITRRPVPGLHTVHPPLVHPHGVQGLPGGVFRLFKLPTTIFAPAFPALQQLYSGQTPRRHDSKGL